MRKGSEDRGGSRAAGFSALEVLVVVAIIGILMAALLPAVSACRRAAQNLKCASQLRSAAVEFRFFADNFAVTRGESEAYGPKLFKIEDYLDSVYRTDEFWDQPTLSPVAYEPGKESLMCPAGPRELQRRPSFPCIAGGIGPNRNVTIAVNMRLWRATEWIDGVPFLTPKLVSSEILEFANVPLLLDVDAEAAVNGGLSPYFTAPPTPTADNFQSGKYWFPSLRHGGRLNVALVDGSVHSTATPEQDSGMRWTYQPK